MAYNLLKDYLSEDNDDAESIDFVSTSPYWVLYIVGVPKPLSFSRSELGFQSIASTASGGHRNRIVIINDCVSLQIANSKSNHTKSLNATLKQGKLNYLGSIYTGDWIMAWIVNNKTDLDSLLKKIKNQEPANDWKSGLKFVGRVNSIRKNISIAPDGNVDSLYTLDAFAFKELDTQLFYDVNLAEKIVDKPGLAWLAKLNMDIKNLFEVDEKSGFTPNNGDKIVGNILSAFMGKGVGNLLNPTGNDTLSGTVGAGAGVGEKKPYAYIVPTAIGKMLNRSGSLSGSGSEKIVAFTDIMQLYTGVQKYENLDDVNNSKFFIPKIEKNDGFIKFSGKTLLGSFTPIFPSWVNRPIWSVLQQFTNPLINEMYTCMRVDDQGNIVPQIIFRQIPFTTPSFDKVNSKRTVKQNDIQERRKANSSRITELEIELNKLSMQEENPSFDKMQQDADEINRLKEDTEQLNTTIGQVDVTPFHELPAWKIPDVIIKSISLGRSDATHVNFVHIYGQDALLNNRVNIATQLVQNPPIRDDLDIQRSGIRTYMATIPSNILDQVGKSPETWMQLIADQLMSSHLTLNGSIQTLGIHMPICEGDNVQIGNMLFHIEAVTHVCQIASSGQKSFITNLLVTNGMSADPSGKDTDPNNTYYLGVSDSETIGHDAGLTIDSEIDDGTLEKDGDKETATDAPSGDKDIGLA